MQQLPWCCTVPIAIGRSCCCKALLTPPPLLSPATTLPQTLSALVGAHSALSGVYKDQLVKGRASRQDLVGQPKSLKDDPAYGRQYENIKATICRKGERSKTVDPQRGTLQDTYTPEQFFCLAQKKASPMGLGSAAVWP